MDEELIFSLKKKWGMIHSVSFRGQEFIFRALTFKEFDDIADIYDSEWDSAEAEDAVVRTAVVYPENFNPDKFKAGFITSLADEILVVSGFRPDEDGSYTQGVVNKHREKVGEFRNMMKAFIIAAMPGYTDEALDQYTFEQLAKKLAMAEKVMEVQQNMYGLEDMGMKLVFRTGEEEEEELQPAPPVLNKEDVEQGKPPAFDPIAEKLHRALMG